MKKQATIISQSIQEEDITAGPEDPLNTNIVFLRKPKKSQTASGGAAAGTQRPLKATELRAVIAEQQAVKSAIKNKEREVQEKALDIKSCSIKWGIIPGSYEDCLSTRFFSMQLPTLSSPKSRKWVVLLDRYLYFFNTVMDINIREAVPLKYCTVSYIPETENGEDGGIIVINRTKSPIQSWYLYTAIAAERKIWMR